MKTTPDAILNNANKVAEYLRVEMQLMRMSQHEYVVDYEEEKPLVSFDGIMEFYMLEKRRIERLDINKRQEEQEKLEQRLTNFVKRFNPTPGIVLENENIEALLSLVAEGLVNMNLETESSAEPKTKKESCLKKAPEFMLQILELLRGKVNEVEEPDKVRQIDKYASYLRIMNNAKKDFSKSPLTYYYGKSREIEGSENQVCYIHERLGKCYSMHENGAVSETTWLSRRKQSLESFLEKENKTPLTQIPPTIELRDELAQQETRAEVKIAVLLDEMMQLKGYKDIGDYRRCMKTGNESTQNQSFNPESAQRMAEIQKEIHDLLEKGFDR